MKKLIASYLLSFICGGSALAQPCLVNVDSLKGQYTGDCKYGKADGQGIATGVDSYAGAFKNGYPEGQGRYTWKNGSFYEGTWKKGLFDGQGTLSRKKSIDPDTVVIFTGFWQKGNYLGRFEKPYLVHSTTANINDLNIRKINNSRTSEITIVVKNITGGASDVAYTHVPKSRLIDVQAVEGQFEQEIPDEASSLISNKYKFRGITYPFYAIFSFETTGTYGVLHVEKVGVEFFENCNWFVQVGIDN
jgi:hypothetical protein